MSRFLLQLRNAWPLLLVRLSAEACSTEPIGGDPLPQFAAIVERTQASVVRVRARLGAQERLGSGFAIAGTYGEVLIVSSYHVVWNATTISLEASRQRPCPATLVGAAADLDLALLRPDAALSLPPLRFGDDRRLRAGDWLLSVGSTEGIPGAATFGHLAARAPRPDRPSGLDYLFADLLLAPGSSGGPTVDLQGQVVGINTASLGDGRGLGVLLPAHAAAEIEPRLELKGGPSSVRGQVADE